MALDQWPAGLPQSLLFAGTTEQSQDGRVRFQPDAGPAIVTNLFTRAAKIVQARLGPLRDYQKDLLDVFVETTLSGGVEPFEWASPGWDGSAGDTFTFRFVSLPTYELLMPRSTLTEAVGDVSPAGPGYVTWTTTQRRWIASFALERLPWFPA
jgi:hypothetical protein